MKNWMTILICVCFGRVCLAQSSNISALKEQLAHAETDTAKSVILAEMAYYYRLINPDSGIALSKQSLDLARKNNYLIGEASALNSLAQNHRIKGDLVATMPPLLEALRIARTNHLEEQLAIASLSMGNTFVSLKDYTSAVTYLKSAMDICQKLKIHFRESLAIVNLGEAYMLMGKLDSARYFLDSAGRYMARVNYNTGLNFYETRMAQLMFKQGKYDSALIHIRKADKLSAEGRNLRSGMMVAQLKAEYYKLNGTEDSSVYYSTLALDQARRFNYRWDILASANKLADLYKGKDLAKAYYYAEMARTLNDSVYGPDVVNDLQKQIIHENELTQLNEARLLASQNRLRQNLLLGSLVLAGLILFWLYRNNQKDKKMNAILTSQKAEIERQKIQVENTLTELKATQAQLIQTEKMASLGELTAGIAHEIQNPLNFVNNFSDLSRDLLQELKVEIDGGDISVVNDLASDLDANLEKINQHGKRAESIVKSMLQHSRPSSGVSEPTDVNQLCDECMRLAFQGYRSKEPSFNAILETSYDPSIGLVNLISADIGRVMINLANNAFYAVLSKSNNTANNYTPKVSVETIHHDHNIVIVVKDNGEGISAANIGKIFQPFFTTKSTGTGTGLGLSIAYDIVKAHQGKIDVKSVPDEGTEFVITLPNKK